jgi:thymidylate synthase (FAD)
MSLSAENPNRSYFLNDGIGFISIVDRMKNDAALKVVNAARISYSKVRYEMEEKDINLVKFLLAHSHTSPFRHSYYTFHVKAPLFTLRQWIKYQVGSTWRKYEVDGNPVSVEMFDLMYDTDKGCSWNEVSGRYAPFKPEFYIPMMMRANPPHGNKQASVVLGSDFDHSAARIKMFNECEAAYKAYEERIESGIAKEIARMMLPQNIYTEAYWTVSLQGVLHFLQQRLHPDAQFEIQRAANSIYTLVCPDLNRMEITKSSILGGETNA